MFWHPVQDYLLSQIPWDVWITAVAFLLAMLIFKPTRWYTIAGIIGLIIF